MGLVREQKINRTRKRDKYGNTLTDQMVLVYLFNPFNFLNIDIGNEHRRIEDKKMGLVREQKINRTSKRDK